MGYDYNDFRSSKVMMAMELQKRGWEIFGWKDDESDLMTDYYSPANWEGIATKLGYVVVVNDDSAYNSGRNITKWVRSFEETADITKLTNKIVALRAMTTANNASPAEEKTALEKIKLMEDKLEGLKKSSSGTQVVGVYPTYLPNPRGCKWHVEKDGVILAKGTGIGKFCELKYFNVNDPFVMPERSSYSSDEYFQKGCKYAKEEYDNKQKIYKSFINCIQKIDATAGGTIGEGKQETYKPVTKTKKITSNITEKVKTPNVFVPGMYFRLEKSFNNGAYKGNVYKITEANKDTIKAYKMDKKLKKTLTGTSNPGNYFYTHMHSFRKWVDTEIIVIVEIKEQVTEQQYQAFVKA